MPPELTPYHIIRFFNDIDLHHHGDLQPNYKGMKEYWAEKFEDKLADNKKSRVPSSGDSADKLNTTYSAQSLVTEEMKRFGGFYWRFTVDDAVEILRKCSRSSSYIDRDQFCEAMEKCMRAALSPPLLSLFRSRRSFNSSRVPKLK